MMDNKMITEKTNNVVVEDSTSHLREPMDENPDGFCNCTVRPDDILCRKRKPNHAGHADGYGFLVQL